ncbi:MAG: tRNA (adenosine(37)-N6)-threonylcarbamoyltransferase complex transferase subunit TsaD [Bacteroidales bacterium]|nr:tRNA (adenosine(37)-N6)-threonylcarbamoyltransferase complex transferase subunit TsaD [Bacteroidales bacterium]HOY39502.1 tRNA (adenosine(37)-N6)-threonylcarbamoyltransferase complex transferase subunit TsaD [Bacteroidales bacterium]HQP05069.1 tRNA (adenosine(37)-N6)-threonylcarbamoyltransferase complex transferase subunit TsaD [Bacteroidales bacterium]
MVNNPNILAIESSCDDTSAAVMCGSVVMSNVIASQAVHSLYGGVVPELASRAHQQNIVPVVDLAIKKAGLTVSDIHAVAFTKGPGLLGSLLVGAAFAKSFAQAQGIPIIAVNHLHGHLLSNFIVEKDEAPVFPQFPYLCLLVSGGHTQLVIVRDYLQFEIIGKTIDDAAGEAFDKCAKAIGLDYPGGPMVDKLAATGNELAFTFGLPRIRDYDYSFSGLKTSFLYTLRDHLKDNKNFVEENMNDLCASLQKAIIDVLVAKLKKAIRDTGIKTVCISGGVAANMGLRLRLTLLSEKNHWNVFLPKKQYTTDNAAMIAVVANYCYSKGFFDELSVSPLARLDVQDF